MDIKDRIKAVMEHEKIAPRVFADAIGIQQSTLSHVLNGRNNPSLEVVMKIHQTYNYLNLEWLLYGNGEMTNEITAPYSEKSPISQPSLFEENTEEKHDNQNVSNNSTGSQQMAPKEIIKQEIRFIEKTPRKITEIRIFFDDNTYEIFRGEN